MAAEYSAGYRATEQGNVKMAYLFNGSIANMAVDGSETPISFSYSPPPGKAAILYKAHVLIKTGTNFDDEKFTHTTALTNGVSVCANGEEIVNIKKNLDITCIVPGWKAAIGNTDKSIEGDWEFSTGSDCQGLDIKAGNSFEFIIQDDLTEINLTFMVMVKVRLVG